MFFQLAYQHHGGSGLNVTLAEVERMRAGDILWYLDRLQQARQKEADAMRKASKPKRAKK